MADGVANIVHRKQTAAGDRGDGATKKAESSKKTGQYMWMGPEVERKPEVLIWSSFFGTGELHASSSEVAPAVSLRRALRRLRCHVRHCSTKNRFPSRTRQETKIQPIQRRSLRKFTKSPPYWCASAPRMTGLTLLWISMNCGIQKFTSGTCRIAYGRNHFDVSPRNLKRRNQKNCGKASHRIILKLTRWNMPKRKPQTSFSSSPHGNLPKCEPHNFFK